MLVTWRCDFFSNMFVFVKNFELGNLGLFIFSQKQISLFQGAIKLLDYF